MKIGVLMICVNPIFWPYAKESITTEKKHFFKGHEVEYMLWTDIPKSWTKEAQDVLTICKPREELEAMKAKGLTDAEFSHFIQIPVKEEIQEAIDFLNGEKDITIFPIDPIEWPFPTLLRYHLFLQQESYLKKFDKLLYIDADMRVVADIDTDIFGEGLTCAKHPMYAFGRSFIPPYEPNPLSTAFIPRFGRILSDNQGKQWFEPVYAAGGVQGGATEPFIEAMWSMKRAIDHDLQMLNYMAIWNDESHWNYYLSQSKRQDLICLDPSYVYPDSLIKEYYEPRWERSYEPKIITITKKHSLQRLGTRPAEKVVHPPFVCPTCHDVLVAPPDCRIVEVKKCDGKGTSHDVVMEKAV